MARRGDADVLLTHAPSAEEQFVREGHCTERRLGMSNDFVLVGPKFDPAQVEDETSITADLTRIAKSSSPFVSRADESGTHVKEQSLWKEAEIFPEGDGYLQAGSGMAQTLRMASEQGAYTITDRGTWLSQHGKLDLVILREGDALLRNQYAVIVVNPKKHPHIKTDAAQSFADFRLGPEAQRAIGDFGRENFNESLFIPQNASSESPQ